MRETTKMEWLTGSTALCILISIICLLSVGLGWGLSESRHRRIEIFGKKIPTFIISETCKTEFEATGKDWTQMDLFNCVYDKTGGKLPDCDFDWRK